MSREVEDVGGYCWRNLKTQGMLVRLKGCGQHWRDIEA